MANRLLPIYDQVNRLVRTAQYEGPELRRFASDLRGELPGRLEDINSKSVQQVKALVLLSEVYDYYGQFGVSKDLSDPATGILDLKKQPVESLRGDELAQSQIRLKVAHGRSLYRSPKKEPVIELLLDCRDYVKAHIADAKNYPCHGTLGEIAYTLGRAYRQRQRYSEALAEFTEAIRLYHERARQKRRTDWTSAKEKATEAEMFTAHKIAIITALGVSWCNYTKGALKTAMYTNLVPARAILRQFKDPLNNAYADVIGASITRALAGGNQTSLRDAISDVLDAYEVFKDYEHGHYQAGALLELALLALAERDIKKAKVHLRDLHGLTDGRDFRWRRSTMIVGSRILRHEGDKPAAREIARDAYDLAKEQGELLGQIDALLAWSEARDDDWEGHWAAINDLKRVLDLNDKNISGWNPKVHAICHLRLIEHYLARGDDYAALESFVQWQKVRDRVEHRSLHERAEKVAQQLDVCDKLEFRAAVEGLDYRENNKRLREFLLRQARVLHQSQADQHKALGISHTEFYEWLDEFGFRPRK